MRVVSSAYLRILIFLPEILTPACASSSPAFLMMYSVYKLNKQGDNTQPWRTPFPIWNQSVVPCPVLTVASWPAYTLSSSTKLSHAIWDHPRQTGHGGEIWQNVAHWRWEWQTTSLFLPWELHEQQEKAKRYDNERWTPQVGRSPLCYWRSVEIGYINI